MGRYIKVLLILIFNARDAVMTEMEGAACTLYFLVKLKDNPWPLISICVMPGSCPDRHGYLSAR